MKLAHRFDLGYGSNIMDLRDQFAVHFAAALAGALTDPAQIARRSYDFADAMLAERVRRAEEEEARAIVDALPFGALDPELNPDDLDPEWLEQQYDPTWDLEPKEIIEAAPDTTRAMIVEAQSIRPGLARTQPVEVGVHAPRVVTKGA